MFRIKSQFSWPVIFAVVLISAMYVVVAFTLLRSYNANIVFTQKELQGLSDYEQASTLYFSKNHSVSLKQKIRAIGDTSNLILDPELSSYYAVDILFNHVPLLVEHVFIYSKNQAGSLQDLPYHLSNLDHAIETLGSKNCVECSALRQHAEAIKTALLSIQKHPINETESKALIAKISEMAKSASVVLKARLEERLQNQQQQYFEVVAIMVGLYGVLVALILVALRNYATRREVNLAKERQKLIVDLAQKNDELEKFAHAAAHDLKEPVRTMRCFATLLKSEASGLNDEAASHISVIENTAKRAEEMINDLLGYTRVSEEELAVETCDCGQEIAAVLADLKPAIEAAKPTIHVGELPVIQTVPSMFRRVMLNLIDNAIKYRREHVPLELRIEAEKQENEWIFSVRDNGIGIAKEHAELVFEPFKRLHPSMRQEGSGIGLTSCKKIIERLGGKIWVEPNPAGGSTIFFSIPAGRERT